MPAPGRADDVIQIRILRFPAQLFDGFFIGRDQHRWIARPSIGIFYCNIFPGDFPGALDDFQHRKPLTVSKIVDAAVRSAR